ncbi:hypothetical protein Tco_1575114 [Tanacetum coccineum]
MDCLSKRKFVIVCHEKVVRIPMEGDEILRVYGERTLGAAKALMNPKVDEPRISDVPMVHDFTDVFPEDLSMTTTMTTTPVAKVIYRLAPLEMQELSGQHQEELNKLTVKNQYPLPRIDDLFDQLQGSRFFSKIDLSDQVIHQLPSTLWMILLNRNSRHDKFVIVFIDEILIYSKSKEEHEVHLRNGIHVVQVVDLRPVIGVGNGLIKWVSYKKRGSSGEGIVQKSYADNRRKPLEFEIGDRVMLKVSPWKGVVHFGKKGKLAPRIIKSRDEISLKDGGYCDNP